MRHPSSQILHLSLPLGYVITGRLRPLVYWFMFVAPKVMVWNNCRRCKCFSPRESVSISTFNQLPVTAVSAYLMMGASSRDLLKCSESWSRSACVVCCWLPRHEGQWLVWDLGWRTSMKGTEWCHQVPGDQCWVSAAILSYHDLVKCRL